MYVYIYIYIYISFIPLCKIKYMYVYMCNKQNFKRALSVLFETLMIKSVTFYNKQNNTRDNAQSRETKRNCILPSS